LRLQGPLAASRLQELEFLIARRAAPRNFAALSATVAKVSFAPSKPMAMPV
jgi:hypothetical protein